MYGGKRYRGIRVIAADAPYNFHTSPFPTIITQMSESRSRDLRRCEKWLVYYNVVGMLTEILSRENAWYNGGRVDYLLDATVAVQERKITRLVRSKEIEEW